MVAQDQEEKPKPPAQVEGDVASEGEHPVKFESDKKERVTLSKIPEFLSGSGSTSNHSGNDAGPSANGGVTGEKKEHSGTKNSQHRSSPPPSNKRKAEVNETAARDFKRPRSKPKKPMKPVPYEARNAFRIIFQKSGGEDEDEDEKLERMEELRQRGPKTLAMGLNDCQPTLRDQCINTLDQNTLQALEKYLFEMYKSPELYDRRSNFPTLVTPSIITDMVGNKGLQSRECFVCNKTFKSFDRYYWKACKGHIMHYDCLTESLGKGHEVLNAHCECALLEP
ncbi:hypothetical protein FGRA07_11392 [Fusarium graminearum]|nr:hypothetical protein FGRA07_11392 [Fusarium graminearum]